MHARPLLLSAIAAGLASGAMAGSAMPQMPSGPDEPAWRSLIQPQYQVAYTGAHGAGPEDTSAAGLAVLRAERADYALPPEYAALERMAAQEAKAAAEADRAFRAAYREAVRLMPPEDSATPAVAGDSAAPALVAEDAEAVPIEPKVIAVASSGNE